MINISNNPKIVNKPWGKEFWIADGREMPFAFKIKINAPYKSSIQFHEFKGSGSYFLWKRLFTILMILLT